MRIVDSVGWIAYLTDDALADAYADHIESPSDLITPTIILHEVSKHALRQSGELQMRIALAAMVKTTVVPLTDGLAVASAEIAVKHKLPMADAIIYATALSTGATLVTSDAHFEGLPQVEYIPRKPAS